MAWLHSSPSWNSKGVSVIEQKKRLELVLELVYYVFDSMLIPLIRSNFHVTESSTHQNRLFYFRHDVWQAMTEPAMRELKTKSFKEVPTLEAERLLESRSLGFSQVRLLPKASGLRPITNLKRRVQRVQSGRMALGKSINSVLKPSLSILKYEKERRPSMAGASLFSVNDIHTKLKEFRNRLEQTERFGERLFFAKVDVKTCFDTIPQKGVMRVVQGLLQADEYQICRYTETKGCDDAYDTVGAARISAGKAMKKFQTLAFSAHTFLDFEQAVQETFSLAKRNVAFTDGIVPTYESRDTTMTLLRDHVQNNLIKHGKRFYRQETGIPQGSVLSTMLCNLFYAEMEREVLVSLERGNGLLLRLIDDFLFISLEREKCIKFLEIMLGGVADYGAEVHPSKSLTNFETHVLGIAVPVQRSGTFPYCGIRIDTQSLEITKDWERRKRTRLVDALSVEQSRTPGRIFHAKMLSALRIQMLRMFLDTSLNSTTSVLCTIYHTFLETAMKMFRYAKTMASASQLRSSLINRTTEDISRTAWLLLQSKQKRAKIPDYTCQVQKNEIHWLAIQAFRCVFRGASVKNDGLADWLDWKAGSSALEKRLELRRLRRVVQIEHSALGKYRY